MAARSAGQVCGLSRHTLRRAWSVVTWRGWCHAGCMDWGALAGVVLGAVLAMAAGFVTELWKESRKRRAVRRLLWHDLLRNYAVLFALVSHNRWPDAPVQVYVENWHSLGETLALQSEPEELLDLQNIFGNLEQLAAAPPNLDPADACMALLMNVEQTLPKLATRAGLKSTEGQLAVLRTPLDERLAAHRFYVREFAQLPEDVRTGLGDPTRSAAAMARLPKDVRNALHVLQGQPVESSPPE